MKKLCKTFTSLLLMLVLLTSLTACGGGGNQSTSSGGTQNTNTETTADESTQNAADQGTTQADTGTVTTISFWYWDKNMEEQYNLMIEDFESKNPNIKVEAAVTPWSDYWTKLQTALPTGSGPDIFWLNHPNAVTYIPAGEVMDITDEIASGNFDFSEFDENLSQPYEYDGKSYGVPIFFDTIATFYNKRLFAEAGVEEPKDGWTWDDFLSKAQQLTVTDGDTITQYGSLIGCDGQSNSSPFILQNGGKTYSDDRMECVVDSPENRETIQWMLDLSYKHKVNPSLQELLELKSDAMFQNEMGAMVNAGLWLVAPFYEALGDDLGIAPLPMNKQKASIFHNLAYCASAKTKNPEQVKEFLKYTTTKESNDFVAKVFLPARRDSRDIWFDTYPSLDLEVFSDAIEFAYPLQIAGKNAGQAFTVYEDEIQKLFNNPELGDGLATLQNAVNTEINK